MQSDNLEGIPLLWQEPPHSVERKLVVWLPGFTANKESVQGHLHDLAERGFVALSFDPVDHGARSYRADNLIIDPASGRFRSESDGLIYRHYWSILADTAQEIPLILDWAIAELGVSATVGVGGISMGGDIAVAAAGLDERIAVVATCLSTADWLKPGSIYELSAPNRQIQALYEAHNPLTNLDTYLRSPAMSFQCVAADPMVPADGALRFVQALESSYAAHPDRLEVVLHEGKEHLLTETMWYNAQEWFVQFL